MFPIDIDFSRLKEVLTYDPQAPMIFSSGIFLWLFAAFMIVYTLLQRKYTARILFVTLFSYYFYYKSSGTYFFLLALVTVCDFLLAQWMDRTEGRWKRKGLVTLSLGVNLGLLAYFKYTNFLGGVIASLMGGEFTALDIFLPVGISFFTFQSLSYTIDVYRKDIKPLTNILDYAFYVSFFPQLVAGPIVRARDFIPQIRKPLFVSQEMFGRGIFLILSGLFKKAIISDYISVNFVERIFDNPTLYSGLENLMGVYGYALQIYCDFSGYSEAFGGALGGFTTGRKEIIDLLRQRSRPYLFSNSLAPGIIGASLEVFKMLKESNALHDKLVENVNYFRDQMTAAGFDIKPTQSAICAVMLYDAKLSQIYAARMQEEGIYVTGFYYPVVPKEQARIRVQISAGHEKAHLDKCIAAFIKVGKELGTLK